MMTVAMRASSSASSCSLRKQLDWRIRMRMSTREHAARVRSSSAACSRGTGDGENDRAYMRMAMSAAWDAFALGEVPVGAVMIHEQSGTLLATAHNETERRMDPTAHAEMLCLRRAALHPMLEPLGGWRGLRECTLYVTLEPCAMCAGAALQSRVGRLVYGARSRLLGAHGGWVSLLPGSYASLPHFGDGALKTEDGRGDSPTCSGIPSAGTGSTAATPLRERAGAGGTGFRPHPFTPDVPVTGGVLAEECGDMMIRFFREKSRGRTNGEAPAVPDTHSGQLEDAGRV